MFPFFAALTLAAPVPAPAPSPEDDAAYQSLAPLTQGEWVFVGKVTGYTPGPTALSNPPIYMGKLTFDVTETLRGTKPKATEFQHRIRQQDPPTFPYDAGGYVVAAKQNEGTWTATFLVPATKETVERAKRLLKLPAGWAIVGDKSASPWADIPNGGWPKYATKPAGEVCAKSGRPALFAGDVEFTVEQVIPAKVEEFKNPYGNGQFKLTVTNKTEKPVEVPALLTDGKTVFWDDSVAILYANKALPLGGAGKATAAQPVKLKPGESVSGVVDTLTLTGVNWPRGGQRVYFDFALGEKVRPNFFYYLSTLHDPLRDAAKKQLGAK